MHGNCWLVFATWQAIYQTTACLKSIIWWLYYTNSVLVALHNACQFGLQCSASQPFWDRYLGFRVERLARAPHSTGLAPLTDSVWPVMRPLPITASHPCREQVASVETLLELGSHLWNGLHGEAGDPVKPMLQFKGSMPPSVGHMNLVTGRVIHTFKPHWNLLYYSSFEYSNRKSASLDVGCTHLKQYLKRLVLQYQKCSHKNQYYR